MFWRSRKADSRQFIMFKQTTVSDCVTAAHYFAQRRLFREAAEFAREGFSRFDNDFLGVWWAYCLFKAGRRGDSQAALSEVERRSEVFELAQRVRAVLTGQGLVKSDIVYRPGVNEQLLMNVVLLHVYEGDERGAKAIVKGLPGGVYHFEFLRGMIALQTMKEGRTTGGSVTKLTSAADKATVHLSKSLEMKPDFTFAILARIQLEERLKNTKEMSNYVNKLAECVKVDSVVNLERISYFVACGNWDLASEQLDNLTSSETGAILLLKWRLVECFVRGSGLTLAYETYNQICQKVDQDYGVSNLQLLLDIVSFVTRVAGGSDLLLNTTVSVLSKARNQVGDDYNLLTELGLASLFLKDYASAENCYQRASLAENNQIEHVLRLVQIKLYKGELEEAAANLDFFREISSTLKCETSEITFLEALLYFQRAKKERERIAFGLKPDNRLSVDELFDRSETLFDEAVRSHLSCLRGASDTAEFYKTFNPSFLLELTSQFMKDVELCFSYSKLEIRQSSVPEKLLGKCIKLLEALTQKLHGLAVAHLVLIKAHILNGSLDVAQSLTEKLLETDLVSQQAHVYALFVALMRSHGASSDDEVQRVLAQSTSSNFELLQNPEFLFLKAEAEILAKNSQTAVRTLQKAKALIEGTDPNDQRSDSPARRPKRNTTTNDHSTSQHQKNPQPCKEVRQSLKAEINCSLAILYCATGEQEKGKALIQAAIAEFAGSPSGIFVVLANSEIAMINKDLKMAIDILKNVSQTDSGFVVSRRRLADIYLNHLRQKRSYTKSLQEIVSAFPTQENNRCLADGLYTIGEFEEAYKVYLALSKTDSENEQLALRIGECLVKTHNFVSARNYFTGLIAGRPGSLTYKVFLCDLLRKTHCWKEIGNYLSMSLVTGSTDKATKCDLEARVKAAALLSEHFAFVHKTGQVAGQPTQAIACLEAAIECQRALIDQLKGSHKKVISERQRLAELQHSMMLLYSLDYSDSNALLPHLEEAIKNDPENLSYHLLHGRVYLSTGNLEIAKEKAKQIFKADFRHKGAVTLFADCLLQAQQFDSGIKGFMKIFEKDFAANNSTFVLTSLVWFHKANGTLAEFLRLLNKHANNATDSEETNGRKTRQFPSGGNDPCLNYCYGVYYYTVRNYNAAIEELARCRSCPELADPATMLLIDIHLHSNSFNLYSNFLQKEKFRSVPKAHLDTALSLVDSLSEDSYAAEKQVFRLAISALSDPTRTADVLKSLEEVLTRPANRQISSIILYFLAVLYLRSKDKERLKEVFQLMKELAYQPKNYFDEYFFRANMLCVDTLLFKDKAKTAKAMIDQCISACRSCLLSYDYLAIHNERMKESCVETLQSAFEITSCEDPNIGYKLAKDLMNEGKTIESFKVCKQVLTKWPKFKQIERDVLTSVKEALLSGC